MMKLRRTKKLCHFLGHPVETVTISFAQSKNNNGPRIKQWGTPDLTVRMLDFVLCICRYCRFSK